MKHGSITLTEPALKRAAISRIKADDIETAAGYLLAARRHHCAECTVSITVPARARHIDDCTHSYCTHELGCSAMDYLR